MSLGTRLTLKTAALVLAVVVIASTAIIGLGTLNRDLDAALVEYDHLREVYTYSNQIKLAQAGFRGKPTNPAQQVDSFKRLIQRIDQLGEDAIDPHRRASIKATLRDAVKQLEQPEQGQDRYQQAAVRLHEPLGLLAAEIGDRTTRIQDIQRNAQTNRRNVQWQVAGIAGLASLLAIAVGVWQYTAVMNPLRRLQRGVNRLSSGDFTNKLKSTGDREFVNLADDFNRMADELATLYSELEEKVRIRSAQLAQSERLASVGFLAAGVAHEINNPLAIIAGEAELALNTLPDDADPNLRQALGTTRDEAFRCKAITQKLVSLARPGSGERATVGLAGLAEDVAALVRTLPQAEGRTLRVEPGEAVSALTDASQLKQVLLNLVINALEATEPGPGRVTIAVSQESGTATIAVSDNGKGLSEEALGRVFQPFYTEKKSPTTPGLGLGLSISHAIVEDLGGTLTASSDGPGRGSVFTIELPIVEGGTTH